METPELEREQPRVDRFDGLRFGAAVPFEAFFLRGEDELIESFWSLVAD